MINSCGLPIQEAFNGLINVLVRNPKYSLEQAIGEAWSKYNEYNQSEIENLINALKQDKLASLFKVTSKNRFEQIKTSIKDIGINDVILLVKGSDYVAPEPLEYESNMFGDSKTLFNTRQDFENRYGTSLARKKLIEKIHDSVKSIFLIGKTQDGKVYELDSNNINTSVRTFQEQVYARIKQYLEKHNLFTLDNDTIYDSKGNYTGAVDDLVEKFNTNIQLGDLRSVSDSTLIDFVNDVSTLQFFDLLFSDDLKKALKIADGLSGIYTSNPNKYFLEIRNHNMTNTFRDEDSDVDGFAESGDIVKRLETILKYRVDRETGSIQLQEGVYLEPQFLSLINARLKQATSGVIHDLVVAAQLDNFVGYQQMYETLFKIITEPDVYSEDDSFTTLALKSEIEKLTQDEINIIVSMYKAIFDNSENSESLYAAYLNTVNMMKTVDINYQPVNFYKIVVQNLATLETLPQSLYKNEENELTQETLEARFSNSKTYYIDQMLNGKFSVNAKPTFKTFTYKLIDPSPKNAAQVSIKLGNFEIIKVGVESSTSFKMYNNGMPLNSFESLRNSIQPFIQEILNIDILEEDFYETLKSVYKDEPIKSLINMCANILYRYAVSEKLKDTKAASYKIELSRYFDKTNTPNISKSSKQLTYNDVDVPLKIALAQTKDSLHNILSGNIVTDSANKKMSLVGLSQLATRTGQQYHRMKTDPTKNPVNQAMSKFTALRAYTGVEFSRDYSGKGTVKKTTKFSVAEHFYSSFVIDYLSTVNKGVIKCLPSIISDKSKIMKASFNLNTVVAYSQDGQPVTIAQLSLDSIRQETVKELGNYFNAIYKDAANVFNTLSEKTGISFDLANNFTIFNATLHQMNEFLKLNPGYKSDVHFENTLVRIYENKGKITVQDVLHEALLLCPGTELVETLHYSIVNGELKGNELLMDQLYRWGVISDTSIETLSYGLLEKYARGEGYGKAKNFFDIKEKELISGLIYKDCEIRFRDDTGMDLKCDGLNLLREGLHTFDNAVFGVIKYYDSKGKEHSLKIIDKDSILNSWIFKEVKRNINFPQYASVRETFDPNNPKFNIDSLVQAINIYQKSKLNKEKLKELTDITKFDTLPNPEKQATLEINEHLRRYQAYDYWMSQEYMNMTVGTHLNHPGGKGTLIEKESKAWANQVKRNVAMTAAKHAFSQGDVTGIKRTYTAAVIDDASDLVSTVNGKVTEQLVADGATICSGPTNYLENNSLGGDRAGLNKKQFVHFTKNGHGGIIKTAGFPITNALMRESHYIQRMNKYTLNRTVRDASGNIIDNIDITKSGSKPINYGNIYYREFDAKGKQHIYKLEDLTFSDEFGTITQRSELINGSWVKIEPKQEKLQNNFQIWQFFGGMESLQLKSKNISDTNPRNFEPSENSMKQLTHAINFVGDKSGAFQKDAHQPLKESLIDYIITAGAIKQGAANVNQIDAYTDDNYELTTMTFDTYDAGIQLNAEHHANESTVSLMTQVVNALSARGFSVEEGSDVYEALKIIALNAVEGYDTNQEDFIATVIVKAVISEDVDTEANLSAALLKTITKEYQSGKYDSEAILKAFPLDHPVILSNAISKISSLLTKNAIKIKFPGNAQVLVPSNGIYKLYQGKMLSAHKGKDISKLGFGEPISVGQIELGKTYLITDSVLGIQYTEKIDTPTKYYQFLTVSDTLTIQEDYSAGRDLAAYNITFQGTNGEIYNMWDLSSIYDMHVGKNELNAKERAEKLQEELLKVNTGNTVKVKRYNHLTQTFQDVEVTIAKMKIHPYEIICGNIYQTTFGLRVGDNVSDILGNKGFFVSRALENYLSKTLPSNYDLELKRVNGDHLYLLKDTNPIPKSLKLLPIEIRKTGDEVFQVDAHGGIVRKLSSELDKVYVDERTGTQVVVTSDFDFYLNNTKFVNIELSKNINTKTIEYILSSENYDVLEVLKDLDETLNPENIRKSNKDYYDEFNEEVKSLKTGKIGEIKNKALLRIARNAEEIHTSFVKSLDLIASRTPAQCYQSFMAMKVVGFDQTGLNNAYVNRMQLYLQGSDYDIDKVSLLGYVIKQGKFVKWSPFMSLKTVASLRASENLPFPTGKSITYSDSYSENWVNLLRKANGLLFKEENGIIKRNRHNPEAIKLLAQLIKIYNTEGVSETIKETELLPLHKKALECIEQHNTYLTKKGINKKDLAINFASTKIYQCATNPVNLIQGHKSVDEITGIIKKTWANDERPLSQRAKQFAPGNPLSKFEQLCLTLGGKENTSISASALKVFEAVSHSFYKRLNSLTDDLTTLGFTTGDTEGVDIVGNVVHYIANAYSKNKHLLPLEVQQKLDQINQEVDAYIYFSGFLSLSTDNAKDPTLTKINAGPSMISLYMAGLTLGVPVDDIVKIMTSDFAWEITNLIENSNVFNDQSGVFDFDAALDYYNRGPLREFKKLTFHQQLRIKNYVYEAMKKWNALPEKAKEAKTDDQALAAITDQDIIDFLADNAYDLQRAFRYKTTAEEAAKKEIKLYTNFMNKLGNENISSEEAQLLQDEITESKPESQEAEQESVNIFKDSDYVLQQRFLKAVRKHKRFKKLNFKLIKEIEVGTESEPKVIKYTPYKAIQHLVRMANEMSDVRMVLGLNQGLENNIESILKFIRNFENILFERVARADMSELEEIVKQEQLDGNFLTNFVDSEAFRKEVIRLYETKKDFINPFQIIVDNSHYFGYLYTASRQYKTMKKMSRVFQISDIISEAMFPKIKGDLENYIKKISKFVTYRINNSWLRTQPELIVYDKPIVLGTPEGNAVFKQWMDEIVIPKLKDKYADNKLLKDFIKFENSKTFDGNGVVQYGIIDAALFPKSDQELKDFSDYKQALKALASETYQEISVQNLLLYYNTVVYNGETSTGSLSQYFEDMLGNQQNSLIQDQINYLSIYSDNGFTLELNGDTVQELLKYIAPVTSVYGLDQLKGAEYARVYYGMKYVLIHKDRSSANEYLKSINDDSPDRDLEAEQIARAGYVIQTERYNKNHYLHGFTKLDIPKSKKQYDEAQLINLARQNGHDVTSVVVYTQNSDGTTEIDEELTEIRIKEISKPKEDCP